MVNNKPSDIFQTDAWARYLENLGWIVDNVDGSYVFIKKIFFFGCIIKIQHSINLQAKQVAKIIKKYSPQIIIFETFNPIDLGEWKENCLTPSPWIFAPTKIYQKNLVGLDLQSLQASYSRSTIRNIKKAKANNLTIEIIDGEKLSGDEILEQVHRFYPIYKKFISIKKINRTSLRQYEIKARSLGSHNIFLFVRDQFGQDVSVIWGYKDKNLFTYLNVVNTKDSYPLSANYFVADEALKWSLAKNIKVFDFQLIYDPRLPQWFKSSLGYTVFKKHFRGNEVDAAIPSMYVKNNFIRILVKVFN